MLRGPDGRHERRYRPLEDSHPELARQMREAFVRRWLPESGFPEWRFDEAMATVDVRLAARRWREDGPDLRITSTFTGSSQWLPDWSGDEDEAVRFADEVASLEAGWVHDERRINGPTPWD
jgi:hypothetical protein